MTDVFPKTEQEIEADKPTPYLAIPFIVLAGLALVLIFILFLGTLLMMAGWWPRSMTFGDATYYGPDIMSYVIMRYSVRGLLIAWPILSVAAIIGERQDRKRRAAAA